MRICPNCGASSAESDRFCSNCGARFEPAAVVEGERKFASILFADVAQSTSIAEKMDPEDWTAIMNGAFGFMNAAVSRYGGTVSRLMGDAVLALFGAPVAHEDDAERAVRAGLEIQELARAYAETVRRRHGVAFHVRVGIHSGTAVLAYVGNAVKTEYTAMGDAANVAARLQSAAEPGTVLISADTFRLVRGQFDVRPRGLTEMKGKQSPVETFEIIGVKAVPGRARGLEGLTSPLIGRDRELGRLHEKLAALGQGVGSVVAIVGEAGLGKSRLVAELRNARDAMTGNVPVWHEARGISYGQSIPYHIWRQIGRLLIGATAMDAAQAVREKLRDAVERLGLPARDIPFVETMLAVDTEESRLALAALPSDAVADGVAGAMVNAIKAACGSGTALRPHVLVIDDLHWSDSASLELTAQTAPLANTEPLLMICVLRPDRKAASWQLLDRLEASLGSTFERIDLEPLSTTDAGVLLGSLLAIEDLPESIRGLILERAEGNPFYLEEVLRSLIDGGQIVRENGHWRATRDIWDAKIPETLAGVLSARIDRLPETTKRVAQTASVIGRVFMHRVLQTVCQSAPAPERVEHVESHIAALSYEQLVRERARVPEREYIFKHAMTCEAAYGLLLRSRRQELHARTGLALEELFADRLDEIAPVLAYHFLEAEDLPRALGYSVQAADNARKLSALNEELEHRERVLRLLDGMTDPEPAAVIDAALHWTLVSHRLNRYEGVVQRLEHAVEVARAANDKHRLATALSWIGNIHMVTGFPSRSGPYLEESEALATELGDERLLLLPLFAATWTLVDRDPRAGEQALKEVIGLARKYNMPDVEAHSMGGRAMALARLGDFDEAKGQIEEALKAAPHAGSPVKQADVHISASMAYYEMGEIEKGLEHARIGGELALRARGFECACAGFFNVGWGHLESARPDQALEEFGRSLEMANLASQVGLVGFVNLIHGGIAAAEFEQGAPDAVAKLRDALSNAQASRDDYIAALVSMQLAETLVRLERYEEALPVLAGATAYYREKGMRPSLARTLELAARLHEGRGRPDEAAQALDEAAEIRRSFRGSSLSGPDQPAARA